jgi:excisionase family DNA binding protein
MSLRRPGRACMVMNMLTATPQTAGSRDPDGRGALTRDEVMTASEVAELLHLPVSTIYYLARRGELPASRLGRAWRFLRLRIERLLEE